MNEKFSVIIPLYNKGPHIARAVESILRQTLQNFEIIVVDDQSSDEGPVIVKSYHDPRISLIKQDHRGVAHTRNYGVSLATADVIAFLDADDEWMPHHLETILRLIKKYPDAGMFATAFKIRTAEGKTIWGDYQYIPPPPWEGLLPDFFRSGALGHDPVNSSVVVIPRKIFYEMGGFHEDHWFGEDSYLFGKIALKYPVAFSWECGAIYHQEALNRACNKKFPRNYEQPFVKTARVALMKGEVQPDLVESVNEFITKREIYRCYWNLQEGNLETAHTILKQCTTKLRINEKRRLLILIKLKLLIKAILPSPVFLFLRDSKRNVMNLVIKK